MLGPVGGDDGTSGGGSGGSAAGPLSGSSGPGLGGIVPPLVLLGAAAGGIWAAFLILGRRRRDDEDGPDSITGPGVPMAPAAAAVATVAAAAAPPVAPPAAPSWPTAAGPTMAAAAAAAALDIPFGEAEMPRWRRPSVQAARKSSSRGPEMAHVPVAFRDEATEGVVRARIGYRLVRVTSIPDELLGDGGRPARSRRPGRDPRARRGVYRRVRAADGTEGWIHKMTLAERPRRRRLPRGPVGDAPA